jgi:CRP/FNR family cyclic AMP-dependent transcriptional regulator
MYDITNISLFSGVSIQEQQAISDILIPIIYPKGTLVIQEGETSNTFFILAKGKVDVFISNNSGDRYVLNTLGDNSFFGELAFLDEEKRSASVVTIEEAHFFMIRQEDFSQILERYPTIYAELVKNLVTMIRRLSDAVSTLGMKDSYRDLKNFLIEQHDNHSFRKKPSQLTPEYIATKIDSTNGIVARLLNKLELDNYISIDNGILFVLRTLPDKLY